MAFEVIECTTKDVKSVEELFRDDEDTCVVMRIITHSKIPAVARIDNSVLVLHWTGRGHVQFAPYPKPGYQARMFVHEGQYEVIVTILRDMNPTPVPGDNAIRLSVVQTEQIRASLRGFMLKEGWEFPLWNGFNTAIYGYVPLPGDDRYAAEASVNIHTAELAEIADKVATIRCLKANKVVASAVSVLREMIEFAASGGQSL